MEKGKSFVEKKDYARALLEFQNAARATPDNPEPYYQLGLVYLAMDNIRGAVVSFRKVTTLNPSHQDAQLKLAELMARSGDKELLKDAQTRAKDVLSISPDNTEALSVLGLAELGLGQLTEAEKHFTQALEKAPQTAKSSVGLASLKLGQKDVAGAEKVLLEAVRNDPQKADIILTLGQFYLLTSQPAKAEEQFRRAAAADPANAEALLGIAVVQRRTGRKNEFEETLNKLSRFSGSSYQSLYASWLFNEGKTEPAIAEFERLAKENPGDRAARNRLISAYVHTGKTAQADKIIAEALSKNPRDTDALTRRAGVQLKEGKAAEAERDLAQVLRQTPDSAEAHYLLADLHQQRGATRQRIQELTETVRLRPDLLSARIDLAQQLIIVKAGKAALDVMNAAPLGQKKTLPFIVYRNWALSAAGDKAALRKGIDEGLALSRISDFLVQDALLRLEQGDHGAAQASASEALQKNAQDLRALEILAGSYVKQNQLAKAVETVVSHASRYPDSAKVQQFAGRWFIVARRWPDARQAFVAAKAADPKNEAANLYLARLDIVEGKSDSARQILSGLLSKDRRYITPRLLLAQLDAQDGNFTAAIEHYRTVLTFEADNEEALNNLAYLLVENGSVDEAIKYAQRAKELFPERAAIDDTVGWAFFRKGVYKTALAHFERAAAAEPTARHKYHLAMAYLKLGDTRRGQEALQSALKIDASLPEAQQVQELLQAANSR